MLKYFSTLSVTQYFTVDFICPYNMNHYPFDIQVCNGTLEPKTNSGFFVKLVPKYLNYLGPTDLMKYQLEKNVSFVKSDNVSDSFINVLLQNYNLIMLLYYITNQLIEKKKSFVKSDNVSICLFIELQFNHIIFVTVK